jgi:hypothetical protein
MLLDGDNILLSLYVNDLTSENAMSLPALALHIDSTNRTALCWHITIQEYKVWTRRPLLFSCVETAEVPHILSQLQ